MKIIVPLVGYEFQKLLNFGKKLFLTFKFAEKEFEVQSNCVKINLKVSCFAQIV